MVAGRATSKPRPLLSAVSAHGRWSARDSQAKRMSGKSEATRSVESQSQMCLDICF